MEWGIPWGGGFNGVGDLMKRGIIFRGNFYAAECYSVSVSMV